MEVSHKMNEEFNSSDYTVEERIGLADEGKFLSYLVRDEDPDVRAAVAYQGYGLNLLMMDDDIEVQKAVCFMVKEKLKESFENFTGISYDDYFDLK